MDERAKAWYGWADIKKGGPGSGNWGHAGRPGSRGGSMPRSSAMSLATGRDWQERQQATKQPRFQYAKSLNEAQAQQVSQSTVLAHIMRTNPPEQVKSGKMVPEQWAKRYMTDEPDGYTAIEVHPKAMFLPLEAGEQSKVEQFSKLPVGSMPPIVVDGNEKIEARFGGGKLDRAYGRQPYTVLDGKHRVEGALRQNANAIPALVPKRSVKQVWANSHSAEVNDWALDYFKKKGYPVLRQSDDGTFVVERQGRRDTYGRASLERIARNLEHDWRWPSE